MPKISVLLHEERDADILRWLETQENNSAAFRKAARLLMGQGTGFDEATLRRIVREELAKVTVGGAPTVEATDDADLQAAARLDQMF
jgi:hypothetical protein